MAVNKKLKLALIPIGLAALGWWWWFKPAVVAPPPSRPATAISIAIAKRQDIPIEIQAAGQVIAYETVPLRSRLDSQIAQVHFHDGDLVQKGDLLFTLDDRNLKALLKQAQAVAENNRRNYERTKELTRQNFTSKAELDAATASFEASTAAVQALQVQLGYTSIIAPITGRTGTINVTVGNTVKANDTIPMVTINQLQPIRIQAALPQVDFEALRQAMQDNVSAQANRTNIPTITGGMLEYIDNNIDPATGTFVTRARFANQDESLWPGMFVTLTYQLGDEQQALVIPQTAVQHGQEGDFVFVIQDNKAKKTPIKVSRITNGLAIITSGLQVQDKVATDGIMSLRDGSSVRIKEK